MRASSPRASTSVRSGCTRARPTRPCRACRTTSCPSALQAGTGCSIDLEKSVAVQSPGDPVPGAGDYADADTAAGAVYAAPGDTLHYLVTLTNDGSNAINMDTDPPTDDKCTLTIVDKVDGNGDPDASDTVLNPDDVWTYSCTHLNYDPLVDGNPYVNVAEAIGHQGNPPQTPCELGDALPCVSDSDPANVKPLGKVVIVKDRIPGTSADSFAFGTSTDLVGQGYGDFSLTDNGVANADRDEFFVTPNDGVGGGSYVFTEKDLSDAAQQPNASGYNLTDITCVGNGVGGSDTINSDATSGSATVVVASGGTVTCTFQNTKQATIVVDKVNNGGNDADAFNFNPSDDISANDFTVSESGNAASYTVAPNIGTGSVANSYTVAETDLSAGNQPAGYRLTGISCPSNGAGGSATVAGTSCLARPTSRSRRAARSPARSRTRRTRLW